MDKRLDLALAISCVEQLAEIDLGSKVLVMYIIEQESQHVWTELSGFHGVTSVNSAGCGEASPRQPLTNGRPRFGSQSAPEPYGELKVSLAIQRSISILSI